MTPKKDAILIMGDSNIKHLRNEILCDRFLKQLPVVVDGVSGRRAMDLNVNDVELACQYRYVIIMVGNNDLGKFKHREAEDPTLVACKIIAFQEVLSERGTRVRVIKLLPRKDVEPHLIVAANQVLQRHLGRNLFKATQMYMKQFDNRGGFHPVYGGKLDIFRFLVKACETFGFRVRKF